MPEEPGGLGQPIYTITTCSLISLGFIGFGTHTIYAKIEETRAPVLTISTIATGALGIIGILFSCSMHKQQKNTNHLKKHVKNLQIATEKEKAYSHSLNEENVTLTERTEKLEKENNGLKQLVERLENEKKEMQDCLNPLNKEKTHLTERVEKLEKENNRLKQLVERLKNEKKEAEARLNFLKTHSKRSIDVIDALAIGFAAASQQQDELVKRQKEISQLQKLLRSK